MCNLPSSGNDISTFYFGEELIPREYLVRRLPSYLQMLRRFLFGADPDRAMINYRANQYLQLLHATELETFVTAMDSRITYRHKQNSALVLPATYVPQIVKHAGTPGDVLYLGGAAASPDARGKLYYHVTVDIVTPTAVEVTQNGRQQTYDIALVDNLSNRIPLGDTGYTFQLNSANPAAKWEVSGYLRPTWDLGQIAVTLEKIGEPVFLELFGLENEEPWLTFRNLWYDNKVLPYKLGGLLLALIYRTDRTNNA